MKSILLALQHPKVLLQKHWRLLVFLSISLIVSPLHRLVTRFYYSYEILSSDGFVKIIPYMIIIGLYVFIKPWNKTGTNLLKYKNLLLGILALFFMLLPAGLFGLTFYTDIILVEFLFMGIGHLLLIYTIWKTFFLETPH